MTALADGLANLGPWNWLIGAALLFLLEAVLPGVYILWFGIAALIVGIASFLIPMSLTTQVVLFVAASVVSLLVGRRLVTAPVEDPDLGVRSMQYVGRTFVVAEAITGGRGKLHVGDSLWTAEGPDASAGARVRVTGARGTVLVVEPVI